MAVVRMFSPLFVFNVAMTLFWVVVSILSHWEVGGIHYHFWVSGFFVGAFLCLSVWGYSRWREG